MIEFIGSKIKDYRIKMGISQSELCSNYMNRSLLSKIENNKISPSLKELEYLSDKLNIPIYYFFAANSCILPPETQNQLFIVEDFYNRGDYASIIKLKESSSENSEAIINNPSFLYFSGMSCFNLDMCAKSLKLLKKYVNYYLKENESFQKENILLFANALNTLFKIMLGKDNFDKCEYYILLCKNYLCKYNMENSYIYFIIHSNLGYLYNEKTKYNKTIDLLESFLDRNKKLVFMDIIPDIHTSLGIAYYNTENYNRAIINIEKSIFFYKYLGQEEKAVACYLNYINALRYSEKFDDAFFILKSNAADIKNSNLYSRFIMQEIILNINIENYSRVQEIIGLINIKNLNKASLMDYYFIKGHIEFINKNYSLSKNYYNKCEKYYAKKHFNKDLELLYNDLYEITGDKNFLSKQIDLKSFASRKNICI